jgi:hypothetical protein
VIAACERALAHGADWSEMRIGTAVSAAVAATSMAAALGLTSGTAVAACGRTPAVSSDKADYGAFDTAAISGSGFDCGATLHVKVTAPDGTSYSGSGTGTPGPDTVTTDDRGAFSLSYALSGTAPSTPTSPTAGNYAGQRGTYDVEVTDSSGDLVASTTFTDASQLNTPVPDSVIVTYNGLEWVWASPCAQNGCTSGILVGKDGFNYATAAQWAQRPPVSAFGGTKCASPYFDKTFDHCDWSDPTFSGGVFDGLATFGSAPYDGLPAGPDGNEPMGPWAETWLVRAPTPSDTTPPVITKTVGGTAGNNGWYTSGVTVTWTVTDPESTVVIDSGCGVQQFAESTASATSTCTAHSAGGSSSDSVALKIDKEAPAVSGAPTTRPNGAGWYNGDVPVHWTCTDMTSGLVVNSCPPDGTITGEGRGLDLNSGLVYDQAGNSASAVSSPAVNIDRTAPVVSGQITSTPHVVGSTTWYADSAHVQWSASDPALADGSAGSDVATGPTPGSADLGRGFDQQASATATDAAGNTGSGTVEHINVDGEAPAVALDCSKAPSAIYLRGSVTLPWTASDEAGGSGLATPGSGSIALDTSAVGSRSAQVPGGAAADNVGHHSAASNACSYGVIDRFSGFLAPLSSDPSVWNVGNAGRTYPVKWQLTDANGAYVTDAVAGTTISVAHVSCPNGTAVTDTIDYASSTGGTALRYDSTANQYVYNWATPSTKGSCYRMTVTTPDGQAHTALFQLK